MTAFTTALMTALLLAQRDRAFVQDAKTDTEVRAARLPARALPLRTRAKMEPMEASIASTVGLSVEVPDRAHAHASPVTRGAAARRQVHVLPPRTRPRTEATAHSTAQHDTAHSTAQHDT